jgi:hypothetical protein
MEECVQKLLGKVEKKSRGLVMRSLVADQVERN